MRRVANYLGLMDDPEFDTPQTPTPTPTVTATPSSTPVPVVATPTTTAKKTTVTCVKGKTTKKVTGVNPKCPAGYKKKA